MPENSTFRKVQLHLGFDEPFFLHITSKAAAVRCQKDTCDGAKNGG